MIDLLDRWARDYPIASIEDGLAEDDWDGWAALTGSARRGGAARRRRPVHHPARPAGAGDRRRGGQRHPDQAQPGRDADRDARRAGDGPPLGLPGDRLRPLGRDRGYDDRRPGRGDRQPGRSRSARWRAPSAWRSTIACCGSRNSWARASASPAVRPCGRTPEAPIGPGGPIHAGRFLDDPVASRPSPDYPPGHSDACRRWPGSLPAAEIPDRHGPDEAGRDVASFHLLYVEVLTE